MKVDPDSLRTYGDVRDFLFDLRNTGMKYGIERMAHLAEALSHPERNFPVIHVAGTNGKGSTCASIESVYRNAGYKTGLYTSPHLIRLNERVQVNRIPIPDSEVVACTRELAAIGNELEAKEEGLFPSFFEFMTALAFLHFKKRAVDVGIIEVGLGGRLDATNVVRPAVTAITSIALDHTHILGDTLEIIAGEKAGIIKPGVPVVLGEIPKGPEAVIEQIAESHGSPVYLPTRVKRSELPQTSLNGHYQRINAAVAAQCVRLLDANFPVNEHQIADGLQRTQWEGRWESMQLADDQSLILDATHNVEGIQGFSENLENLAAKSDSSAKFTFVVGVLGRDRAEALLPAIAHFAEELIWVKPDQPRASAWSDVSDLWPESIAAREARISELFPKPNTIALSKRTQPIIVTGSIYLIGEIKTCLAEARYSGDADLQDDVMARPR